MLKQVLVLISGIGILVAVASRIAFSQAAAQWSETQIDNGYVVFGYNTLENLPASFVPKLADATNKVSCALAGGQSESVHFGVYALMDGLTNIKATVTCDIPVTIYHRIDPDIKAKLAVAPYEEMPTWMGAEVYLQKGNVVPSLAKGSSVGFWLTFRAGEESKPGVHLGKVTVETQGRPATELALTVTVRPFKLESPRAAFGMYYREDFLPARFGSWAVSDTAASAIYRDMAAHGQNSVSFYNMGDFKQLPPTASLPVTRTLALARQAGLTHQAIPSMAMQSNLCSDYHPSGLSEAQMKAAVEWLRSEERKQGWPEIMVYGWDEAPYPAPGLRETYGPMRKFPIRLCAAMNATGAYAYGDVHDVWIVMGGDITPEMRAEAKRLGAQVWTYSYRILREGFSPLRQRYYAGLYTWALGLGGNYVWAYSHGHHGHAWCEPDSDEPMPITGWEARREGVDDYRYLQTLEESIKEKRTNPTAQKAAAWMKALRDRLRAFDPHKAEPGKPLAIEDYEAIRATASGYIQTLGVVPPEKVKPIPVTYVKDEAAVFRGKPVKECQAALRSSDVPVRRAAASALFEMGHKAAPAVAELTKALNDPQIRIPALRAIETMGPDGYLALPGIKALLSNKDDFVRLSATFALVGLARPGSWSDELKGYDPDDVSPRAKELVPLLRKTLADRFPQVSDAAAFGLYCCGAASVAALPTGIDLLEKKTNDEAATKVLAGLGPEAASAVPALMKRIEAANGRDPYNCQALAAIGTAASEAAPMLEKYRTPDNPYLADVCYALYCLRGDQRDLTMLAEMIGQENLPYGAGEWYAAARFLGALGGKAAPAAALIRERISMLEKELTLRRQIETICLKRIAENAKPLRLLPR